MLGRVSTFAAGRRSKWAVIAFWVVLGFTLFGFQPKRPGLNTAAGYRLGQGLSRRVSLAPLTQSED